MHDDQHGTAVVILAAMINAAAVVGKRLEDLTIVLNGSGAAGTATIKMLLAAGVRDVIAVDRDGAINRDQHYAELALDVAGRATPTARRRGSLRDVLRGADAFIGVSAPNILNSEDIKQHGARSDRVRDGQPDAPRSCPTPPHRTWR
jgi:malate dehydrogenase (oxaloacetate-decarboxylating)